MPKDFRGRCKGYAFVEYENAQDCATAIEAADQTQYFSLVSKFLFPFPNEILIQDCLAEQSDLSPLPELPRLANAAPLADAKAVTAANEDHISKGMEVNVGNIDPENLVSPGNILLVSPENIFLVNPLSLNRGNSVLCALARALLPREGLFN